MEGNPHSLRLYLNNAFYDLFFFLFLICLFRAWRWGVDRQYHSVTLARLILCMQTRRASNLQQSTCLLYPQPSCSESMSSSPCLDFCKSERPAPSHLTSSSVLYKVKSITQKKEWKWFSTALENRIRILNRIQVPESSVLQRFSWPPYSLYWLT